MTKQFDVRLQYAKPSNIWVILGGILGLALLAKGLAFVGLFAMLSEGWSLVFCIVLVFLSMTGLWWYIKKQVAASTATVTTDQLQLTRAGVETAITIPFAQVAAYHYMVTKEVNLLIFSMKDGQKIKVIGNNNLSEIGAFEQMEQAIEQAVRIHQQRNT